MNQMEQRYLIGTSIAIFSSLLITIWYGNLLEYIWQYRKYLKEASFPPSVVPLYIRPLDSMQYNPRFIYNLSFLYGITSLGFWKLVGLRIIDWLGCKAHVQDI